MILLFLSRSKDGIYLFKFFCGSALVQGVETAFRSSHSAHTFAKTSLFLRDIGIFVELRVLHCLFYIIPTLLFHMPKRKKKISPTFQEILGVILWLEKSASTFSVYKY